MADERGEPAAHFDFYGRAGRRGQDDDGGDQVAQRPDRLAIVARRETRFPVSGSLIMRTLFQTMRPA